MPGLDPAGATGLGELRLLLRAYGTLAASCDDQRALVGDVSRRWIAAECERQVCLADLDPALWRTPRGREILARELFRDPDVGAEDLAPDFLPAPMDPSLEVNSNRLPKLEPAINAAVLAGVMLLGVRRYGAGGRGRADVGTDLILATLVQGCLGRRDRLAGLAPGDGPLIDAERIERDFGAGVRRWVLGLRRALAEFEAAVETGAGLSAPPSGALANALAALSLARLRLTARAAGDCAVSLLSDWQRAELRAAGVESDRPHPELPSLERDFRAARAALALPGVDRHALREPLGNTLMLAVADALADPVHLDRLVGRRGRAVHEVHNNLPMMEYFNAAEAPTDPDTVQVAALEMMRYLDKCRRKGHATMLGHAFQIVGLLEQLFGAALDPAIAATALLHDVVEDGAGEVAGYDQSLGKIRMRFGGPLAAMVSEVTDSPARGDPARKAELTCRQPGLIDPREQYDVGRFTAMPLRPSDAASPYTLAGILVKLADTIVTQDEGLRDPDLLQGWWRHSGIRVYWAQRVRGAIVVPLSAHLAQECLRAKGDPGYASAPQALPPSLLEGLQRLLLRSLEVQDLYAAQNLQILAGELALEAAPAGRLIEDFFAARLSAAGFRRRWLDGPLGEAAVAAAVAAGRLPSRAHCTLCRQAPGQPYDPGVLLEYRVAAIARQTLRRSLGVRARPDPQLLQGVLRRYRAACPPPAAAACP